MTEAIKKEFGPVTYTMDEYRFWHQVSLGKWSLRLRLDRENEHPRIGFTATIADAVAARARVQSWGERCRVALWLSERWPATRWAKSAPTST